jgi:hypothetical protein
MAKIAFMAMQVICERDIEPSMFVGDIVLVLAVEKRTGIGIGIGNDLISATAAATSFMEGGQ